MKLDLKFEFVIDATDKETYVYKIDQNTKENKKKDIRDKAQKISSILFDLIATTNIDMFFFIDEVIAESIFKLFIYVICTKDVHNYLQKEIFEKEQLKVFYILILYSLFAQRRNIRYQFLSLKRNIKLLYVRI